MLVLFLQAASSPRANAGELVVPKPWYSLDDVAFGGGLI